MAILSFQLDSDADIIGPSSFTITSDADIIPPTSFEISSDALVLPPSAFALTSDTEIEGINFQLTSDAFISSPNPILPPDTEPPEFPQAEAINPSACKKAIKGCSDPIPF